MCSGTFFLPRDQSNTKPKRSTNYEGLLYMGEYPLAWAACQVHHAFNKRYVNRFVTKSDLLYCTV